MAPRSIARSSTFVSALVALASLALCGHGAAGRGDGESGGAAKLRARAAPAPEASAPDCGHVFILNTDIRLLACDVWLLPVSREMAIDRVWSLSPTQQPHRPRGFGRDVLAVPCREKTEVDQRRRAQERFRTYESPLPIVADVISAHGGAKKRAPELMEALRQFLALAAAEAGTKPARFGRALPLVALPIFGAGLASDELLRGDELQLGETISATLDVLHAFARSHRIDVALCTIDNAAFGAALNARRKRYPDFVARAPPHAREPERWRDEVERLAQLSLEGQLALFLGAGVSINAGLPSWPQLLEQLATAVGFSEAACMQMRHLDPLEAATVCAARAGGEAQLKELVSAIVGSAKRHSLQHALLAALPFRGAITTNYDELFEQAVRCAGGDIAVLPTQIGTVRDAWLLKMHGSVDRPRSIVLTRADYVRFSKEQAASEGLLQGLLLTQHVLFVGFGMRDENWCRISASVKAPFKGATWGHAASGGHGSASAHVQRAPRAHLPGTGASGAGGGGNDDVDSIGHAPGARALLGTILSLQADDVLDELWEGILHVTPIDAVGARPAGQLASCHELAAHARSLEIFLDFLVSEIESKRCRVLLNPKFTSLLSPNSRALRHSLERFLADLPTEAKMSGAFKQLLATLLIMGLRTEAVRALVADQTLEGPYHRRMSKLANSLPNNVRSYRSALTQPSRGAGR